MNNNWKAHIESTVQNITGFLLGQSILYLFDVPFHAALWMGAILLFLSYVRTYMIRRFFLWWWK